MRQSGTRKAEEFDAEVGLRVRHVRKLRGLSQDGLAAAVGITFQQVQKYERGANRISCSMLKKISAHLGVRMSELLGEEAGEGGRTVDWTSLHEPEAVEIARALASLRSPALKQCLATLIVELGSERGLPKDS